MTLVCLFFQIYFALYFQNGRRRRERLRKKAKRQTLKSTSRILEATCNTASPWWSWLLYSEPSRTTIILSRSGRQFLSNTSENGVPGMENKRSCYPHPESSRTYRAKTAETSECKPVFSLLNQTVYLSPTPSISSLYMANMKHLFTVENLDEGEVETWMSSAASNNMALQTDL